MAKSQNYLFCLPRILTCGGFSFLAILIAAMCLSPYVVAEDFYQTKTMGGTHDWTESEFWSGAAPTDQTSNNYFVGHNFVGQNPTDKITFRTRTLSSGTDTFPDGNTLWMGYNMDEDRTFSTYQAELAVKAPKFEVNDLQLGNAFINKACKDSDTVTLDGKMTVNGTVVFGFANSNNNKINVLSAIDGAGEITISKEDTKFNKDNLKISHPNNAFKGTLNVTEGCSVLLNAENAMKNASSFIINSGATLKLQNYQSTLNNLSGSGTVSFTGNALTLNNIATEDPELSGNTEFSGVISGAETPITVTKTGNGMLTFSGSGMYSGETNVQAGTLRLAGNALSDDWQIDVSSGATLEYFVASGETKTVTLSEINKIICDDGTVAKSGAGTLTLTGAKTYTSETKVKEGKLILTGDAIVDNGPITVNNGGTLEYNLASGQTKKLTITDINKIVSTGEVIINGEDSTSQLCIEAQGGVDIESLTVSSGRVDIKGYMIGHITVDANGVFSPGNSVGEATFGGGFILNEGAELLIEVDRTGADVLACKTFTLNNNGTVKLDWQDDEIPFLATCDIIVSELTDLTNVYNNLKDHFDFSTSPTVARLYNDGYITISLAGDNNNIIKLSIDRNAVPEPSTWALLVIGAAGLLYVRKRKN